jgi:Phosphomannomutase
MEKYGKVDRTDGVKVYFDNGSVLVRRSETEPLIRVFYEGVDEGSFLKMKELAYKIMPWK